MILSAAPRVARQGEAWWGKKDSNLRSHKTADLQFLFGPFIKLLTGKAFFQNQR